jgi:gluconokinase
VIVVLTGVSGSGKSTVGLELARQLSWPFYDGDDHHPPENVRKMRAGIALEDADRGPWLDSLRALIDDLSAQGRDAVIAASLLKEAYRARLARPGVRFVFLKGEPALIRERLAKRTGHFFAPALLDSQLDALEEPRDAISVDVAGSPEVIAEAIRKQLFGLKPEA